jgi:hypothetical protein
VGGVDEGDGRKVQGVNAVGSEYWIVVWWVREGEWVTCAMVGEYQVTLMNAI